MFDLSQLQIVSREVIQPEITDLIQKTPFAYNLFPKTSDINSRGSFMIATLEDNASIKWFEEGGIYPVPSRTARVKMNFSFTRLAGTTEITRDVLEGANKETVINTVAEEVVSTTRSLLRELSEQIYNDGSGVKAVAQSASGTLITFYSSSTYVGTVVPSHARTVGSWHIRLRGRYNLISGDGSARTGYGTFPVGTVLPIPSTNNVMTCIALNAGALASFDVVPAVILPGDMLVWEDSYNRAIFGLPYHINSGTSAYQGLPTRPNGLRCFTVDAAGTYLTVGHLLRLIMALQYNRRNDPADSNEYILISSPTQVHRYHLLADVSNSGIGGANNLNSMPGAGTIDFGYRSVQFQGIRWIIDVDCPDHIIYMLNLQGFKIFEYKPLSAVFDGNGWMPVPAISGSLGGYRDRVTYTMTWKGQLACNNPQKYGASIVNLNTAGLAGAIYGHQYAVA